jgi:hypothetical protein
MNDTASGSKHTVGDLAYDAVFVGGIGGGLVMIFFLIYDILARGQALFTPSLMGSVLFDGASAASISTVNMTAVAKYSVVHLFAFSVLGFGIAYLTHQAEIRSKHPLVVIAVVFLILEIGFWVGASLAIPGVLQHLGVFPVAAANLLAAVGVGSYLAATHRGHLWGLAKPRN